MNMEASAESAFAQPDGGDEQSILPRSLQALRGRYRLTCCMALLAAFVGSIVGWVREEPAYQSNGMIRITPLMQRILYTSQTEKNAPPPAPGIFEAFVQSQVSIIRSQQLIDRVMQRDEWAATGESRDEQAVARFWNRLEVRHPPRTELIRVSYRHPDPDVATLAVQLVIRAYRTLQGRQATDERIQALLKNEGELEHKLESIREEITAIASLHGTTDLTRLFNMQMIALAEIESAYRTTRMDLIMAESSAANHDESTNLHENDIARLDPLMMSYIQKRENLQNELVSWRARYTDEMPGRTRIESEYADVQHKIEERRRSFASSGELSNLGRGAASGEIDLRALSALREREKRVSSMYEKDRALSLQIGMDDLRVQTLQGEADLVQSRLEEVKGRVEQLRVESAVIGKINVISEGDRPLVPIADRRRTMAGAGGFAGACFAVATMVGLGLFERRIRYSDDVTRHVGVPVFGVVPEVGEDSRRNCLTEAVVRDLRWALELRSRSESRGLKAIAVAGDASSSGTSSVALALGISFAGTGSSTALVDLGAGDHRLRSTFAPKSGLSHRAESGGAAELATSIHNLTVVDPTGGEIAQDLPFAKIQSLLDQLRARFEVVLIDCGSLDSSHGAEPAYSIADASILVCSRGASVSALGAAVDRLRSCEARILGAIFNRAHADDLPRHTRPSPTVSAAAWDDRFDHLGPIAAAMLNNQKVET